MSEWTPAAYVGLIALLFNLPPSIYAFFQLVFIVRGQNPAPLGQKVEEPMERSAA